MQTDIQTIIQGGAVGIAVLMIGYSLIKDKMYNKTLNNHFNHFTEAINHNSEVIGGNTEVIKRATKALDRVEKALDNNK